MATRNLNNGMSRKKKLPENMHLIAEINEKAREHGMSYGKYVSEVQNGDLRQTEISRRCKFHPDNEFIECSPCNRECHKCGWNDDVKARRVERMKRKWAK